MCMLHCRVTGRTGRLLKQRFVAAACCRHLTAIQKLATWLPEITMLREEWSRET